MKTWLSILFCILTLASQGQQVSMEQDSLIKAFLKDVLENELDWADCIIADGCELEIAAKVKVAMGNDNFPNAKFPMFGKDSNSFDIIDSFVELNKSELAFIEASLKASDSNWLRRNFANLTFIPKDTIDFIFKKIENPWSYYGSHYKKALLYISQPIFFRNNTLCLFSFDKLPDHGFIYIFKKGKNKWAIHGFIRSAVY